MNDPDWYDDWRHEAFHQLQEKNTRLKVQFKLDQWPRFDYDLDAGTLTFSENGQVKVIAEIQIAGTTSLNAGNWFWAWANEDLPTDVTADAERTCAFGEEYGIGELISGYVEDENLNALGWELTGVAARVCESLGAYRPPREKGGGFFLLYRSIRWAI